MAAHTQFPPSGAEPVVRGDPATMVVRFLVKGVDQDITGFTFRSFVRDRIDGTLINECEDFTVVAPNDLLDLFPDTPSAVPSVLLANWTAEQTQDWASGFVADLEQLTPVKRTPIIFDTLRVDKDVSNEPGSP
jgi:hypothetical protein